MRFLKQYKYQILLACILFLGFFLRFYQLSQNPPGVDWDEASSIYNGYSIAQTGKDEYKETYPILFKAYNAYVPPVLIYLDAASSAIFGLTAFAARFPTALLGTLSVLGMYLLLKSLTRNRKLALFSALFLALSPWHITYSRVGTFASVPLVFILFGTHYFIKGTEIKRYLIGATFCFVIAVLSYYSAYVFVPIFVLVLVLLYRKKINLKLGIFLIACVFTTTAILFLLPGGQVRMRGVSPFSDPDLIKKDAVYAASEIIGKIIHNRRFVFAQILLDGYFSNFRFDFLFSKADSVTRFIVPGFGFGLLYWWEFPVLIIGMHQLIRNKWNGWQVIFIWLLLALIPSAPTLPRPASTRALLVIPALTMIVAYGSWYVTNHSRMFIKFLLVILFSGNVFLFLHQYFIHFPQEKYLEWFSPYKELFAYINKVENSDKKVLFVIDQPGYLDEVHMFTAFYNQIDPRKYQSYGGTQIGKLGTVGEFSIDNYIFIPKDCNLCGKEFKFNKDDLVVIARKLPQAAIATFPKTDHPVLFIYNYNDISLEQFISNTKSL